MEKRSVRHFVLIHGAGHGAWCWYKVATLLQSAGHTVTALDLGASGIHPKQGVDIGSMMDYVEPLFEFMEELPSQERVILVGHSMGGGAVAMAMERFPEKIAVAIFATAMMPGPDLDFVELRKEFALRHDFHKSKHKFDDKHGRPRTPSAVDFDLLISMCYQLSPPEDFTLATYLLRPTLWYPDEAVLREQTSVTEERYGSVRRVFIVAGQDRTYPEDMQRLMIEKTPPDEVKAISDSDHMVMFSRAEELCSHLQEIAESYA